jgi:hypothetical protein
MQEYSTTKAVIYRFLRVAGAMLLSGLIPTLIDAIPQVNIDPKYQIVITAFLIPFLTALDKAARDKGWYGYSDEASA